MVDGISEKEHRFPFCIVWTPLPIISWFIPIIGHMGIANSRGIIRDFAGSYYVAEDDMGFGWPTCYLQLDPSKVEGGVTAFDNAVRDASDEYKNHMHNICCDNCHSHTALALDLMNYDGKANYNMVKLCFWVLFKGTRLGVSGWLKQFLPSLMILAFVGILFGGLLLANNQ
ncbi:unnamed protein product [Bursaphelenchus okinawaensis]|uniref:Transmembrane protein 222 n=1 Tax=Bursaphelenchus okinawaensis TaxID=465554 RepID=A0A811K316_9BILA|nr:unnamed protein product [Bursaphelenchus okinawaensis]CAG9091104.1 unnamed protein product [Bursaphelenchus okinawaensis]